eukprot:5037912-Lingulodinium_polyedra.AAC.1
MKLSKEAKRTDGVSIEIDEQLAWKLDVGVVTLVKSSDDLECLAAAMVRAIGDKRLLPNHL